MKIYLYDISRAGLYEARAKSPKLSSTADLATELVNWVQGKPSVSGTKTIDDPESVPPRIYCVDAATNSVGDTGLILWNESPSKEGAIASIPLTGSVGEVLASEQDIPQDNVPGWPSYAWMVPGRNLLIMIQPENLRSFRGSGVAQVRDYVQAFLTYFSSYAVVEELDQDGTMIHEVSGYRAGDAGDPLPLSARFETKPVYEPGALDEMRARSQEIRKLIFKAKVHKESEKENSMIGRIMDLFDGVSRDASNLKSTLNIRVALDWKPENVEALNEVIEAWEEHKNPGVEDVGLQFEGGGSKIHWFAGSRSRLERTLPATLENSSLWSIDELDSVWRDIRAEVFDVHRTSEVAVEATSSP